MELTATPTLPPGPTGNLLLRRHADLREEAHFFIQEMTEKYGDIFRLKAGPYYFTFLGSPDYIEQALLNRDVYVKLNEGGNLRYLLGNGLLTSEGDFWMKQRRLIQPVFHKQKLQGFADKIVASTNEMLNDWQQKGDGVMDAHAAMNLLTLDIVGRTLLSTNVKGEFGKVSRALTAVLEAANKKRGRLMRFPEWVPVPLHLRMQRNKQILDDTITDIIEKRRKETKHFDDLLTMLMEVEDADTAERMTDKQLRDEVLTIFVAGHETTANAMAFTFYLLAKHPEVKARLDEEINSVLQGNEITYGQLAKLEYTQMVLKESMRLYPPAWVVVREAAKDDEIDGYTVKAGDKVIMSPYVMHRNPKYWDKPDEFIPERFSGNKIKEMHRYTYFPFGGGARLCIGNNFAMMEMQIILALVSRKYNITLPPGFSMEAKPYITLRPKDGMMLKFTEVKE